MTEEMTLSQKLVEFLYSIGLPPMRILRGLIALLVIGTILGALYFFNFDSLLSTQQPDDDSGSEFVESDRQTYEFDMTLDQQIDELTFYDSRRRSYVVVYGELQQQNDTIEELRQRSGITLGQTSKLNEIQLRNLQTLFLRTMQTGVSADAEKKSFDEFANKLANGSDDELKDFAQFAIVRSAVIAFGLKATDANGQMVIDALNQYQSTFVNTKSRAEAIRASLENYKKANPASNFTHACIQEIGKVLGNSTDADIRKMAKDIGESSLFAKLDIKETLESRIRYQDREALMDLDKALRVLEAHPEIEIGKWKTLMRCYEASLSTGRVNDFETGQNIMSELVAKLPNSDQRKTELIDFLARQTARAQQLGKPIDLLGVTIDGKPIEQATSGYTGLILLDRSEQSRGIMQELASFQKEGGGKFRPIIAFKDKFTEEDAAKVNTIPQWIFVANEDTAEKYSVAFPNDIHPYVLLIDKDGVVVAGNLSLVQVANRMAALDKQRKTAAEPATSQ